MSKKATKQEFVCLYNEIVEAYFKANSIYHKYGYEGRNEVYKIANNLYKLKNIVHSSFISDTKKTVERGQDEYACLLF